MQAVTSMLHVSDTGHPVGMPAAATSMLSGSTPALLAAANQPRCWKQISHPAVPTPSLHHLLLQLPDAAHAVS